MREYPRLRVFPHASVDDYTEGIEEVAGSQAGEPQWDSRQHTFEAYVGEIAGEDDEKKNTVFREEQGPEVEGYGRPLSLHTFRSELRKDSFAAGVIAELTSGMKAVGKEYNCVRVTKQMKFEDGLLYYQNKRDKEREAWRLYVPEQLRVAVLVLAHHGTLAGHRDGTTTLQKRSCAGSFGGQS